MRCEVIAVGTELLLGQIIDTNSAWIGEQLALTGIDSHFQTKVGDNLERIVNCLRTALERSEAVIVCGGLGPTQDDITREAIARLLDVPLIRDEQIADKIRQRFHARNRTMPTNNLRQAEVPVGASVIAQMPGTAPGLICPIDDRIIYAVPGVPSEMRQMMSGTILPHLQQRAGIRSVIKSRTLRTWGAAESELAERLAPRIEALDRKGNPTLAFLASGIEGIRIRITAKAPDSTTAGKILAEEENGLRTLLGDLIFGSDDQTMESVVIEQLRTQGRTLGLAETVTGGLAAARLTAVPGAESVLQGAVLANTETVASRLLNAASGDMEATARTMAVGVRRLLNTDIGLAATGVLEARAQQPYPVGTVFLGMAMDDEGQTQRIQLPGQRDQIRQFSVISLLNLLRLRLRFS